MITYDRKREYYIMKKKTKWEIVYYKKVDGDIPVVAFLKSLSPKMRAKAYNEIELLQEHGIYLREPYVKPIKGAKYKGLYELRIRLGSDASRIFYFTHNGNMFVLLNGFLKKTNKTPKGELEKAISYRNDYEKRCNDE